TACLLIVDVQEKFALAIPDWELLTRRVTKLVQAAEHLELPILVSEQYPQGLGPTASCIREKLPESAITLSKTAFGCLGDEAITQQIQALNRPQILVCGLETHVCVNQTVHQLLAKGYQPHVVQDAVASRSELNYQVGLAKMRQSGAIVSSVELALFELMQTA